MKFSYADTTTITITADDVDISTQLITSGSLDSIAGTTSSVTLTGSLTCNLLSSGCGGLDTGAKASNKGYYIFVITKTDAQDTPMLLCSLRDTAPMMPLDYTYCSKPIWFISSNSNGDVREFTHTNGRCYYVDLDDCLALASGLNYDDWGIIECSALAPNNSTILMETWAIATDIVTWDEETEAVKIRRGDRNSYHLLLWLDVIKNAEDNTRKTKTFPLEDSEMGLLYRWLEDPGLGPPEHPSLNVAIHGWILK